MPPAHLNMDIHMAPLPTQAAFLGVTTDHCVLLCSPDQRFPISHQCLCGPQPADLDLTTEKQLGIMTLKGYSEVMTLT